MKKYIKIRTITYNKMNLEAEVRKAIGENASR